MNLKTRKEKKKEITYRNTKIIVIRTATFSLLLQVVVK